MKNRFTATVLFLAVFLALPLRAESKAQKIESLIQDGSVKKIKKMMIGTPSLADASYGESKDSLLIVALKNGRDYSVIKLLLDAGVNPKKQNADGDSAVIYAAKCGADPKILDALISYDTVLPFQRKSRVLKKNNEGLTALDYAANENNQGQVAVINRYLGIVDETPAAPEPAPEVQAKPAAKEAAEVQAEAPPAQEAAPAPVSEPAPEAAATAAAAASAEAAVAAAVLPPENGQDLQKAAAEAAARSKRPNKRSYLFDGIEAFDTYGGARQAKRELIADPDKAGPNGVTLLHKAAKEDDIEKIILLRDSGANFNLADKDGYTPLMYAARFAKKVETVALLLSNGANAKARNRFGLSAIEIAAADNTNPDIIAALLPKSKKDDSKKALVAAVGLGRPSPIAQKFFDAGMTANEIYKGKSLLMYAAESNSHTDCIKFLLEKGADKTMLSSDWKDAYYFASQNPSLPHNDVYWSLNNAEKN